MTDAISKARALRKAFSKTRVQSGTIIDENKPSETNYQNPPEACPVNTLTENLIKESTRIEDDLIPTRNPYEEKNKDVLGETLFNQNSDEKGKALDRRTFFDQKARIDKNPVRAMNILNRMSQASEPTKVIQKTDINKQDNPVTITCKNTADDSTPTTVPSSNNDLQQVVEPETPAPEVIETPASDKSKLMKRIQSAKKGLSKANLGKNIGRQPSEKIMGIAAALSAKITQCAMVEIEKTLKEDAPKKYILQDEDVQKLDDNRYENPEDQIPKKQNVFGGFLKSVNAMYGRKSGEEEGVSHDKPVKIEATLIKEVKEEKPISKVTDILLEKATKTYTKKASKKKFNPEDK